MGNGYRARLIIEATGDSEIDESGGELMQIEVGVPKGRLRATQPGTSAGGAYAKHRLYLMTGPDRDFVVNAYAPSNEELRSPKGSRRAQVPGHESAKRSQDGSVTWYLFFDESSPDEIEEFIQELEAQGCIVERVSG